MPAAMTILILCEILGTMAQQATGLPVPGTVLGMFLLAAVLILWQARGGGRAIPEELERTAEGFLRYLGLLFVPAGVGVIVQVPLLRAEWLPILAGLLCSTVLSMAATGLVMHWAGRKREPASCAHREGMTLS